MSASKLKLKQGPLDVWSVRERLSLACSVLRNGDQNWVSVSRAIKPFGETDRPPEWFSQKNCALQYSELLEKVETPKRKRGDQGGIETPGNQIIRKLTIERIEELKAMVQEEQQKYKKLKKDAEMVKTGQWDDKLPEVLAAMQAEKAAAAEAKKAGTPKKVAEFSSQPDSSQDKLGRPTKLVISPPSTSEAEDSTQDSMISNDDDSNLTIPGNSMTAEVTETGESPSPQLHPLTVPGAMTKLQTIPVTPVPTFQAVAPGGNVLPPASASLTTPQTNLTPRPTKTTPPSSPLLSSLLKSKYHSPEILQQMKTEVEQGQAALALAQSLLPATPIVNPVPPTPETPANPQQDVKKLASPVKLIVASTEALSSPSTGAPTLSKLLAVPAMSKSALSGQTAVTVTQAIPHQIVEVDVTKSTVLSEVPQPVEEVVLSSVPPAGPTHIVTELAPSEHTIVVDLEPEIKEEIVEVKEEVIDSVESLQALTEIETKIEPAPDEGESDQTVIAQDEESATQSVIAEDELQIKEEPLSPCSSVSSRVSEAGVTKSARRRGKQSKGGRRSTRLTRKSEEQREREESSVQPSDGDSSDEERESDGSLMATKLPPSTFSESIPNSPLSQCSDTEDERAYKSWKKSIMLVWRAVATHKYASLFLHPVTNDIAPGYRSIVHRPMDLSMIKKNLESGVIRTTAEFQRDMMLMFTNAIMYNSSDHNVFRLAVHMYNDVLQDIEQYVSTQLMVQSNEAKPLRASRHSDKEEDAKKRRTSADQQDGGKSKKRKP